MIPTSETRLKDYTLHLKTVQAGEIGIAHIAWQPDPQLLMSEIRTLPADTLPDATIAGVVDFIQAEARFYEKRQR